jgi:hypothetical protein
MKKKLIFDKEIYEYAGSVHIHTKYSFDGEGEVEEIVNTAKQCQLDFIAFADHLSLEAKKEISQKKYDALYVLAGYEMNDSQKNNHYLVFNTDTVLPPSLSAKEYVKKVAEENGIGFIAHPVEKRHSKRLRTYQWDAWDVTEFDGIEIWNFMSEWTDSLIIPYNFIFRVLFPNLSIKRPRKEILKKWDEYNLKGFQKSAVGSSDAHGKKYALGHFSITLLPHKKLFNTIRTYIWLKEELNEKNYEQQILYALKRGNSFIVNYNRGDPNNFYCGIISKESKNFALPGEQISLSEKKLYLYVSLSQNCYIKIIHNGKIMHSVYTNKITIPITKPGFYRIEVYKGANGWIYSNPVYVK